MSRFEVRKVRTESGRFEVVAVLGSYHDEEIADAVRDYFELLIAQGQRI